MYMEREVESTQLESYSIVENADWDPMVDPISHLQGI